MWLRKHAVCCYVKGLGIRASVIPAALPCARGEWPRESGWGAAELLLWCHPDDNTHLRQETAAPRDFSASMSALGQERTLPACLPMSAFPQTPDVSICPLCAKRGQTHRSKRMKAIRDNATRSVITLPSNFRPKSPLTPSYPLPPGPQFNGSAGPRSAALALWRSRARGRARRVRPRHAAGRGPSPVARAERRSHGLLQPD